MIIAMIALLWHWAPPTTGGAPQFYVVQIRDPWGVVVLETATYDTSFAQPENLVNVPCRIRVAGVDAMMRQGPWSAPSDLYTPRKWVAAWMEMGFTEHVAPLTHAVSWARALSGKDAGGAK